jgi:hypothetical protein
MRIYTWTSTDSYTWFDTDTGEFGTGGNRGGGPGGYGYEDVEHAAKIFRSAAESKNPELKNAAARVAGEYFKSISKELDRDGNVILLI